MLSMQTIAFDPSFIFLEQILFSISRFLGFLSNFQGLVAMETKISQLVHVFDQNE